MTTASDDPLPFKPAPAAPPMRPGMSWAQFRHGLSMQLRIISALALRDLVSQFGSTRILAWLYLIRPCSRVLLMYVIGSLSQRLAPQGMPLLAFIITGYITWYAFLRSFQDIGGPVGSGVMIFPNVTAMDVLMARAVVDWATYSSVFVLFLLGGALLGQLGGWPDFPFGVIFGFYSAWWLGVCLGILAACGYRYTSLVRFTNPIVRRLGIAISGVLFVGTAIPTRLLPWFTWNPLFHCLEIIRESWWAVYRSPFADPWFVVRCMFWMTLAVLLIERVSRRRQAT